MSLALPVPYESPSLPSCQEDHLLCSCYIGALRLVCAKEPLTLLVKLEYSPRSCDVRELCIVHTKGGTCFTLPKETTRFARSL